MDTTVKKKPKTMAELLPGLEGLVSEDVMKSVTHTATKKPRPTIANTRTTEKVLKPMTIAEMFTDFRSLQSKPISKNVQETASSRKKWNASCKAENKTISHSANGQMRHNSVRKVLNFQPPKPKITKPTINARMTMMTTEAPKFPKPEIKYKKPLYQQARNTVRISGICNIPETPVVINKPMKSRMTIANKENIYKPTANNNKPATIQKPTLLKKVLAAKLPDSPLSNSSWKSSCDSSFLQNEQDIDNSEKLKENKTKIVDISLPVSTPFTDYRNVNDYFNNTNVMENTYHDNTIMSFENTASRENSKMDESVILSLCNMLNKATMSPDKQSKELHDLLEVQKQTEINIQMIENGIKTLTSIKEAQIKSLQYVKKLIQEKNSEKEPVVKANVDSRSIETPKKIDHINTDIKKDKAFTRSPSYKIPKKNSCIKKKMIHKSMPNITGYVTPEKDMGNRALSMYLQMKEHNKYLITPQVNRRPAEVLNTPAMTSHNLQQQLDRLYGES